MEMEMEMEMETETETESKSEPEPKLSAAPCDSARRRKSTTYTRRAPPTRPMPWTP